MKSAIKNIIATTSEKLSPAITLVNNLTKPRSFLSLDYHVCNNCYLHINLPQLNLCLGVLDIKIEKALISGYKKIYKNLQKVAKSFRKMILFIIIIKDLARINKFLRIYFFPCTISVNILFVNILEKILLLSIYFYGTDCALLHYTCYTYKTYFIPFFGIL